MITDSEELLKKVVTLQYAKIRPSKYVQGNNNTTKLIQHEPPVSVWTAINKDNDSPNTTFPLVSSIKLNLICQRVGLSRLLSEKNYLNVKQAI